MKNKKLHNIKKTGFKTPNNYFESIEDIIFNKLKDDNALVNTKKTGYAAPNSYFDSIEEQVIIKLDVSNGLDGIKATGFNTPETYFEDIEDSILNTLDEVKATKAIPLFSRRNILYISGIAAAIMAMIGIFSDRFEDGFDALDIDVVETYLEEQNLDTYDIASVLTEEDLSQDDFGIINDSFSEESLEDYLIDNANLEDIIEQ